MNVGHVIATIMLGMILFFIIFPRTFFAFYGVLANLDVSMANLVRRIFKRDEKK